MFCFVVLVLDLGRDPQGVQMFEKAGRVWD